MIFYLTVNLAECAFEQQHLNDKDCYGYRQCGTDTDEDSLQHESII